MINILHVLDKLSVSGSSVHGVTRALSWWLPRMDSSEFSFTVSCLREKDEAARYFEQEGIPVRFMNRGKFDIRTVFDLVGIIKELRIDILHLHGYGATNFGRIAGAIANVPCIVHEHTVIDDQPGYQTVADWLLSPLTTRAIAISSTVKRFMIEKRKINPDKIECFFYGIPLDSFKNSEKEIINKKKSDLGVKSEQPIVSSVGRLDTQKGQIYLLHAAKQVFSVVPNTVFLIIGDGPDYSRLQEESHNLGISNSVIFTGHRDDVPDLLAMSDVIALPSLWEGGPITLFEAMSIGKPVVGTPVGLMPEIIQDGHNGFVVPIKESRILAERIIELLVNQELATKVGAAAKEKVQEYDMHTAVNKLSLFYKEIKA